MSYSLCLPLPCPSSNFPIAALQFCPSHDMPKEYGFSFYGASNKCSLWVNYGQDIFIRLFIWQQCMHTMKPHSALLLWKFSMLGGLNKEHGCWTREGFYLLNDVSSSYTCHLHSAFFSVEVCRQIYNVWVSVRSFVVFNNNASFRLDIFI